MTAANFDRVLALLLVSEGGYVNNPRDPGGATKYGITIATLRNYRGRSVTVDDVRQLTADEAGQIYHRNYWSPVRGDLLPAGVDYAVFDFAVNSGPRKAAEMLQECLSVTVDSDIGPVTWRAAAQVRAPDLINALCDRRLAYLRSLRNWADFGAGWSARVARVRADAILMAGAKTATAPPILPSRQPGDPGPQPQPSPQPASGGLSHVPVAAGAGAAVIAANQAGVPMWTIAAIAVAFAAGLIVANWSRIRGVLTADPTAKPVQKTPINVASIDVRPQQATSAAAAPAQPNASAPANAPQSAMPNNPPPAKKGT